MMRCLAILVTVALLAGVDPSSADPVQPDIGQRVADQFAAPATEAFASAAHRMADLASASCETASEAALQATRDGFAALVEAWGAVSVLRFGPMIAENRFERVFFWPDPRGVIVRQTQALLAEKDETALAPDKLAGKSVAVQGLPALEYVLFGAGAEELAEGSDGFRCRYGLAIAQNIAAIADKVAAQWRIGAPFHAAFARPVSDHATYRTSREVAGEVVKAVATGLQFTRNAELLPPLGESADKARGKRAPLWRSDLTFTLMEARIAGLIAMLAPAGFGQDEEAKPAIDAILFDLGHARDALHAIRAPAEAAFADTRDRERLTYVSVALEGANRTLGEKLSAALGLTMGFNALDGD